MHKRLPFWLVLFAVGAMASLHAQAPAAPAAPSPAALSPGQIVAAKVTGTVTVSVNGATKPLNTNDAVPELATVATGKDNSSVVLVFSNGATTQLGSDSSLEIQQFLQEPFSANVVVANLDAEPTVSKTRLHLNKGELVGNVKHLNHGSGSTFVVNTPVGAAGIRGTTFKIVFRPNGTGLAFFSLSTVEGNVNFQQPGAGGGANPPAGGGNNPPGGGNNPPGGGGTPPGGGGNPPTGGGGNPPGLPVTGGNEVVITVTVNTNATTGALTVTVAPPVVTTTAPISAATLAQVTQQAVTIATTAATVTFTPTPPAGGSGSGGNPGGGTSGGNSGGTSGDGSGNGGNNSGSNSGSGSGSGNSGNNSGSGNGSSSGSNGNGGSNSFTNNPSPPIVPSTPRVTTGDGKSG